MIVVIDTNVYVSALVFGGTPKIALIRVVQSSFQLAVSTKIKVELTKTLHDKFGWSAAHIRAKVEYLWMQALWCSPAPVRASRDPDDDHILGCAVAAKAQMIITGDKDLLVLHPFDGISIITPSEFLLM